MPSSTTHRHFLAPAISVLLLVGIWADHRLFHLPDGDAAAYHDRVRSLADRLPYTMGEWAGTDVPPPEAAVTLLRPNLLLGREYHNARTGEYASLVIVQCRDARDMTGHWPPVCYPAHGWELRASEQRELRVEDERIPVTIYRFTMESMDRYSEVVIYNFFVRPDGTLEGGRDGVRRAAEDPRLKVFGAAQVQVVFRSATESDRRDAMFQALVAGALPIIQAVRSGESNER